MRNQIKSSFSSVFSPIFDVPFTSTHHSLLTPFSYINAVPHYHSYKIKSMPFSQFDEATSFRQKIYPFTNLTTSNILYPSKKICHLYPEQPKSMNPFYRINLILFSDNKNMKTQYVMSKIKEKITCIRILVALK